MSPLWWMVAGLGGFLFSVIGRRRALREPDPILRLNYAGRPVPVVLGRVLVRGANTALLIALALALLAGQVPQWPVVVLLLGGTHLLMLVGAVDDRSSHEARGLRGHLASLLRGRVTTGILKLIAGVGVAVLIALFLGGPPLRVVASALVIALSINVVNALDVRPGRALTWWLLTSSALAWAVPPGLLLAVCAYTGGVVAVGDQDVRERGMLGDAGSNPLGLVLGASLAASLPTWGVLIALAVLAGLQIAAETVTISRLIDAVPRLRWFDRLGRRN
jgi:UDP-GlcNAc:undecaprenyl-phosphate/decaprenyl-phosphate GlcNAc-1-phosphate transferase